MTNFEWLRAVNTSDFKIYSLAENAVSMEFGQEINELTFNRIQGLNEALQKDPFDGFQCTVPAYVSLTVFFDPVQVMAAPTLFGINCFEKVSKHLLQMDKNIGGNLISKRQPIHIPVCYDEEFGPDLVFLMKYCGLTKQEIINIHSAATYKVHMIGFLPGFAYLGGMSEQLLAPRKSVPRAKVPAGSVGIAGAQTGIYPLESPGGWQLIGQTPLQLFDLKQNQKPSLLKAGDEVIFTPIGIDDFKSFQQNHAHQNH